MADHRVAVRWSFASGDREFARARAFEHEVVCRDGDFAGRQRNRAASQRGQVYDVPIVCRGNGGAQAAAAAVGTAADRQRRRTKG